MSVSWRCGGFFCPHLLTFIFPYLSTNRWNLVDIVAKDHFGDKKSFDTEFARPIKLSRYLSFIELDMSNRGDWWSTLPCDLSYIPLIRATDAADEVVQYGEEQAVELSRRLYEVYLRRTKEDELADVLPEKVERIIFCEPSPLQKAIYKHVVEQPDFTLLKLRNAPCDCGVNQKVRIGCTVCFPPIEPFSTSSRLNR